MSHWIAACAALCFSAVAVACSGSRVGAPTAVSPMPKTVDQIHHSRIMFRPESRWKPPAAVLGYFKVDACST
jgi:hypothetical protein